MKSVLLGVLSALAIVASAGAQVTPVYKNFGSLVDPLPPIDATTVDNYGSIVSSVSSGPLFTTSDTLTLINEVTGYIAVAPGVQFAFVTNSFTYPMNLFSNRGTVYGYQNVIIKATNVVNTGPTASLQTTKDGKIHIEAQNANFFQSSIQAGIGSSASGAYDFQEGGYSDVNRTYSLPQNMSDYYWGAGVSGTMDISVLNNGGVAAGSFPVQFLGTNRNYTLNGFGLSSYSFYYTYSFTRISSTSLRGTMQMVFVNTNLIDEPGVQVVFNSSTNSNGFQPYEVLVQFARAAVDPVSQQPYTNYLDFRDQTATRAQFAVGSIGHAPVLYVNSSYPGRFRPDSYPVHWRATQSIGAAATATNFDSRLMYISTGGSGRFSTNIVTQTYAAYSVNVSPYSVDGTGLPPTVNNLTNAAGRVEISANSLNLGLANIQAENLVQINATNLSNSGGSPSFDAPNVFLQLKSPSSDVTISNMFPSQVNRLSGNISAWSGIWTVQQFVTNGLTWLNDPQINNGTNTIDWAYHVLVLDNTLTTNQPVYARNLTLNSTNNVNLASGNITVDGTFHSDSKSLTVGPTASLTMANTSPDLNSGNLPNLMYLTNYGLISVSGSAAFGSDRATPYAAIVNYGTIQQGNLQFASDYFENSGTVQAFNSLSSLLINAATNNLKSGFLYGANGLELDGGYLQATNTTIVTGGLLQFGVTSLLTDLDITNTWFATRGISITTKPTKGDLLSTSLTIQAGAGSTALVDWLAQDRGDNPPGYVNNLALGRLVLDATASSGRFYITSLNGTNAAMYIDTIELQDYATNYATQIIVDPNITVYFANTSTNIAPDKLTNAFGGRFVWVSTNTYSSSVVTVQVGNNTWATMSARDYTRFLANGGNVATPSATTGTTGASTNSFAISQVVVQDVQISPNQPAVKMAFISWQGTAGTTYYIETKATLNSAWTTVASLPCNTSGPMTYADTMGTKDTALYRVRYQPGH